MNTRISLSLSAAALLALAPLAAYAASAPSGFVDFGKLPNSASGGQSVEVNVGSNLISMVTRLVQKNEPEVADLLKGLQSIHVNVIGLDDGNRSEVQDRVRAIRSQLDTDGWERVVSAQEKKQDVGVFIKTRGADTVEGVVVTVLDGKKQAVLINVVGDIKPEKLGVLGDRFNIDPLKKLNHGAKKEAAEQE
jgi:hypothetical protein